MKLRTSLFALGLAAAAQAQNSLPVLPTGNAFIWVPPAPSGQTYFNLTVNTTVTIQGLDFDCASPPETAGSIELWLTNPGTTTHVGNELNPAMWSLAASGPSTIPLNPGIPTVCFTNGVVLQPGTRGVAVRYVGLGQVFVAGNGTNQTFSNAQLTVQAGAVTSGPFTGTFPPAPYVFVGTIFYANGAVPHSCATDSEYGNGCYMTAGSFFQRFTAAAATAAALNGRSLSLLYTGVGYSVLPGINATYIAPSGGAQSLPALDDAETPVPLPLPLPHPGGLATTLYVHSNGYVSTGPNNVVPGTNNFTPVPNGLLNANNAMWAVAWHDFNAAEAGSGVIKHEQVGNLYVFTWDNVESYPAPLINRSTFQVQFDLSSGIVNYVWQTMAAAGGSAYFDETVVGYSPDGASPKPDPVDIPTLTFVNLVTPEVFPLTLSASTSPELGATVDLTTSNEGAPGVGINFLSTTQVPAPGIDLGIIGAPGCVALMDVAASVGNVITNLGTPFPSMTFSFAVPVTPTLAGVSVFSQSIWLDPAANPFGAKTSSAVALTLGTFGF